MSAFLGYIQIDTNADFHLEILANSSVRLFVQSAVDSRTAQMFAVTDLSCLKT